MVFGCPTGMLFFELVVSSRPATRPRTQVVSTMELEFLKRCSVSLICETRAFNWVLGARCCVPAEPADPLCIGRMFRYQSEYAQNEHF
jgi:hypothetical protein